MEIETILLVAILLLGALLLNKETILSDWSSKYYKENDQEF